MKSRKQTNCLSRFVVANAMVLFFAVVNAGCGGDAKQAEASHVAEVKAAVTTSEKSLPESKEYIPAMYLERSEFLDSNAIKYKDKLVLRLSMQKDSSRYLLSVLEAGKSGKGLKEAKLKYPKAFASGLAASGAEQLFEEHHTKENDYQQLWQDVKKYTLVKYVIFEPELDSAKHFCYKITGVEKLPTDLTAHGFATKTYRSHPSSHVWK